MSRERWRWGVAEGLFVLLGILGAFAIDAWWDRAKQDELQSTLISAARDEAEANRVDLRATLEDASLDLEMKALFLGGSPSELSAVPGDSVARVVFALFRNTTFEPRTGAALQLLATPTGDAQTLELHRIVSRTLQELEDAEENRERLLSQSAVVLAHIAPYALERIEDGGEPLWEMVDNRGPQVLGELRRDSELAEAVLTKSTFDRQYALELARALRALDSLQAILDGHLNR